jgi:acetolactate synthase I/III small subunit
MSTTLPRRDASSPHPAGVALRPGPTSPLSGEVKNHKVRVLSVLVEDSPNTLTKLAGAIRRRGFHVRGISVGPSREAGLSRITLEVDHGHAEADQVRKQIERLIEVHEVEDLTDDDVHTRELVVAKVSGSELARLLQRGAKVISSGTDGTTIEFSGSRDEIFDFVEELARHGIVDVVRSGPVVMRRDA